MTRSQKPEVLSIVLTKREIEILDCFTKQPEIGGLQGWLQAKGLISSYKSLRKKIERLALLNQTEA